MKKTKSIGWRLSGVIIGLFLILFLIYSVLVSINLYQKSIQDSEKYAKEHSKLYAAEVSERFEATEETIKATKHALEALANDHKLTAQSVLSIMKQNLDNTSQLTGISIILEKNIAPKKNLVDSKLLDENGRYIPYMLKNNDQVNVVPAVGYDNEEISKWYAIPKNEDRTVLTEPQEFKVGNESIYVASIATPIYTEDHQFAGVITAGISMDFLNELVKDMKPDGGYASIITDNGTVVANSINPKITGTNMANAINWKPVKSQLAKGDIPSLYVDSKQLKEQAFNAFAPIKVEGADEVWSVQSVVPKSSILATFKSILTLTIIAGVIIIILMAAVSFWFIHHQLKPLASLRKSIEKAASGDLTEKIDESQIRPDEIGLVAIAFNDMLDQTNEVIGTVKESTSRLNQTSTNVHRAFEEVSAASEEVAAAVEQIAQGAQQQSIDAENTNQQMVDLSSQIDALAALSANMDQLSLKSAHSTKQGIKQVELLRNHHETTNDMNNKVEAQISVLSLKMTEINAVIESIQGITAQTNLLALNASIEAARAGEHGKGFAVVAEEVRKLAEQSRTETESIQHTVKEILNETAQTVSLIQHNIELMETTNQSVSDTETTFMENASVAKEMGGSIEQLSHKLEEMLTYKERAMEAIRNVAAISDETAASAEEVSASAVQQQQEMEHVSTSTEHMKQIAGELEDVIECFK
ncbi:methyl-accepting chemotaxis protein [Rummeliibacillus stabekisii]|uniref:methyl-accepting chemotaxis protein n=1 Tax=Rummeliibacillus stabekisii TaxID=241244 RepID=UPI00203CB15F|nr:methyl-accepting chemotaxis protein [Rummeliibacillus stabekisii]MCM3315547.1 methyl-accepting chemotaxis protein [Rummeliibacillus stabekisii]